MTKQIKFRDNPDNIVTLTVGELDDLIYSATQRAVDKANSRMYIGMVRAFFDRWDHDHAILINEMEQIRIRLNAIQKGDNAD